MPPIVFLLLALLCGVISRCLLIKNAFGVSVWWGFGVFLPFGPAFFRMKYPDEVHRARLFGLASLPLVFAYVMASPEMLPSTNVGIVRVGLPGQEKYALQIGSQVFGSFTGQSPAASTTPTPSPASLAERMAAHQRELARLAQVSEALRLRKRDLLKSDVEGARAYDRDAIAYNAELAKANAEHVLLASSKN